MNNNSVLSPPPPPSGFPPRRGLGTPPNGSNGSNNSVNANGNGNNDDDNENPTIDYYKRREIEDEITSNLFENVVFANMEEMMKCNLSPEEKQIVSESVQSTMYQGFVGGVSSLVLLRGYRAGVIGRILSSFKNKRRALTTTTVSNSTPLRYAFLLGFDVSLSCFVGCGIILNSVFSQKLIQGMAKIPMLPGKTTISQSYCNSAIAEYQLMEKEYKSNNNNSTMALDVIYNPQTVNLQGFYDLYQNCLKRKSYETMMIRKRRGGNNRIQSENASSVVVEVPPPGIPNDFPITLDEDKNEEDDMTEKEESSTTRSFCTIM